MSRIACMLLIGLALLTPLSAVHSETLRLGILKFGTVAWELDTIRHHRLARAQGLTLEVKGFASKQAAAIAFQGGEVDAIATDFIWVARQRAAGRMITFAPYSATVGAVMVPTDSTIGTLDDLKQKRIGIAGGPLDKSWLMLRALLKRQKGYDPADQSQPVFGAPPLLRKQFEAGNMDALITFWHYAARLEAAGYKRLSDMNDIALAMGGSDKVSLVGYVFNESLSSDKAETASAFLRASRAAKAILLTSETEWERLRGLTKAGNDAELDELKRRFREGITPRFGDAEMQATQVLFSTLAEIGGPRLVGGATSLDRAAFHPGARY